MTWKRRKVHPDEGRSWAAKQLMRSTGILDDDTRIIEIVVDQDPKRWPRPLEPEEAWQPRCVRCGNVFDPKSPLMQRPHPLIDSARAGFELAICDTCRPGDYDALWTPAAVRALMESVAVGVAQVIHARHP